MNTLDDVSLIVGFLLPAAIAVVTQQHWPSPVKGVTAFACCFVAAFATTWAKGDLAHVSDWVQVFVLIFAAAIGTYHAFWKPSGIAPAIEAATSPTPPRRP